MKRSLALLASSFTLCLAGIAVAAPPADAWDIGPVIKGKNYSVGMPTTLSPSREGAYFDFPGPTARDGHVHYVTLPVRDLRGARSVTLRYRIDAAPGTRFVPQEHTDRTAMLTMYLQRRGDSWTKRHPDHRWYAPASRMVALKPGTNEVTIRFDENWKSVFSNDRTKDPRAFEAALRDAARIGFVFGSQGGRGHGVYATRPARFTVLDFRID